MKKLKRVYEKGCPGCYFHLIVDSYWKCKRPHSVIRDEEKRKISCSSDNPFIYKLIGEAK